MPGECTGALVGILKYGLNHSMRSCYLTTKYLHNLTKIILDSMAPALGVNDRDIKTETDIPKIEKRDYGIFFYGNHVLRATGEITIKITEG